MRVAEASSLKHIASHHLHERDPWKDRRSLERLATWCEQLAPNTGLLGTDVLAFNIQSSAKLFGGEARHVETARQAFRQRGLDCRLALADTVGAAWGLARYGRQTVTVVAPRRHTFALEPLPVEALRLLDQTIADLHALGITRIGQVVELPREDLTSRFGEDLIRRIDQAMGTRSEPIIPFLSAPDVTAKWNTESPIDHWDLLEVALTRLLQQVIQQLPINTGIVRLRCRLKCERHPGCSLIVGLVRPTAQQDRLLELIRLQWESLRLTAPVTGLQLDVMEVGIKTARQNDLFPSATRDNPLALADLIERLSARLGRERVVHPDLVRETQPELTVRYEPLVGGQPLPKRKARLQSRERLWQRPLHVERRPLSVHVISAFPLGPLKAVTFRNGDHHMITHTWGPERIQTSWWRGRMISRDYYRVETGDGQWFWLFRRLQDGKWFLHGRFA